MLPLRPLRPLRCKILIFHARRVIIFTLDHSLRACRHHPDPCPAGFLGAIAPEAERDSRAADRAGKCGPPDSFLGTLDLAENRSGLLRLTKSSQRTKWLQFQYRWLTGMSEQATWDEVIFDGSSGVVELKRKEKVTSFPFSKFSAIRMRELSQGEAGSLWHMELLAAEGRNVLFATSSATARLSLRIPQAWPEPSRRSLRFQFRQSWRATSGRPAGRQKVCREMTMV